MKDRLRNYGLWVSVIALIPMILELFGVDVMPEQFEQVGMGILSVLVMAGILNNPTTSSKWFLDDKKEKED